MIQDGLQEPWPPEVTAATEAFQQGHLVEVPPLFYATDLARPIWALGRTVADEAAEEEKGVEIVALDAEHGPPYGLITSQTCEITEDRPDPLYPWVQVAPVYACDPLSRLYERDFVLALEPPHLEGEGWVVDLRLEVPLEKSLLVGRTPIESFGDQRGYEELGRELGSRRARPALGGIVHEVFTAQLLAVRNTNKTSKKKVKRFRDRVHRLKLAIEEGPRLEPRAARLYVVTRGAPGEEMEEFFGEWWDRASEFAATRDFDLLPTRWLDAGGLAIDLGVYEELIDLRSPL